MKLILSKTSYEKVTEVFLFIIEAVSKAVTKYWDD
jgi:hypothetical protein